MHLVFEAQNVCTDIGTPQIFQPVGDGGLRCRGSIWTSIYDLT